MSTDEPFAVFYVTLGDINLVYLSVSPSM